ncbi:actin-regulating kinase Prk1p [Monosporozyma servazzii]
MNQPEVAQLPQGHILIVGSHQAKIVRYLASGGFAQVYIVEISPSNKYTGSNIACLKRVVVPDKIGLNVLRAEVDAMKLLQKNKHVVSYIDSHASKFSEEKGSYEVFMLMEYCERGGLIDFLNTRLRNRLSESEILNIMNQTCQGVAAMHKLNPPLIHRDIKIENVLISNNSLFKVCDFGSVCGVIRPPKNAHELMYVQHDIMKSTTAQYRAPEMLDLTRGFPIDEKSDIWALGVFLYKLCYYTTPFEKVGESAILAGKYQYPAYPQYSDRMKNLIRVLLTQHPFQRPNICQVLEEVSRMQGIPCPIKNFYLERVKESEFLSTQTLDFPVSAKQFSPPKNMVTPVKLPQVISPLKPQLSPLKNSVMPLQYSQTMNVSQQDNTPDTVAIPNFSSPHVSKSFASIEPHLQIPVLKPMAPDDSPLKFKAIASKNQYRSTNSYSNNNNIGGIACSPTRKSTQPQNNTVSSKYVNAETQTENERRNANLSRTNSISSISSSISSVSARYGTINDNATGGSIVRKLSEQLKKVMTNEPTNTSPVRTNSRNDTGNSIKSTIDALRNSVSGISNNVRSFSADTYRSASSSSASLAYKRNVSSESFAEPENSNKMDRRMKYNSLPPSRMSFEDDNAYLPNDNKNVEKKKINSNSNFLGVPENPTPFQSPSPMKFAVDSDMKSSIQKRVMDLLKAAQKSPVKKTASGYGKYTQNDSETYQPKSNLENRRFYSPKPIHDDASVVKKTKPKVPLRRQASINVASRQPSVVVNPLPRSASQSGRTTAKKLPPPPIPSKPTFLRPQPPTKSKRLSMMVIPQDGNINATEISRASSNGSIDIQSVNIDKLEQDFRRRFPSTVQ